MKSERSKDILFAVITAIFFWSLCKVLDMEPVTWLPITGLYITGTILLNFFARIVGKE